MTLFEDDGEISLTINKGYAQSYDAKKKQEELSYCRDHLFFVGTFYSLLLTGATRRTVKDKYGDLSESRLKAFSRNQNGNDDNLDSDEESTSEEEDENGELVTPELDAQIIKTLVMLQSKVPEVYRKDTKFFTDVPKNNPNDEKDKVHKKTDKVVTLKDLERNQILRGITDTGEAEEEELKAVEKAELTHVEEQALLKKSFESAALLQDDEDGEFFVKQVKSAKEKADDEEEYKRFLLKSVSSGVNDKDTNGNDNSECVQKWNNFEQRDDIDNDEKFLMSFILNRGWMEKSDSKFDVDAIDLDELEDDEEEVEEADRFEMAYNFRYEEEGANNVKTYSRNVDGSVRRKNSKRKEQRQRRDERKKLEEQQKVEELKRLKNLKRQEICDRLKEIQEITGNKNVSFDEIDLEEDFDPEKYDQQMSKMFNDEYYDDPDASKKPKFDSDDIDISDLIQDDGEPNNEDSILSKSEKNKKKKSGKHSLPDPLDDLIIDTNDTIDEDIMMDADYLPDGIHFNGSRETSQSTNNTHPKSSTDSHMDEIYRLDFEDIVGGMPTRFGYRQVRSEAYGLSVEDIFEADEKDLNQFVSLKKIAPYRKAEKEERDIKKLSKKHRVIEFRRKVYSKYKADSTDESKQTMEDSQLAETTESVPTTGVTEDRLAAYLPKTKKNRKIR